MMKHKTAMLIVTLLLMMLTIFSPQIVCAMIPTVTITKARDIIYTECVTASGTLENTSKMKVELEIPVIAEEILVKPGDRVSVGQKLFTINKKSTIDGILGSATLTSLLPSYINKNSFLQFINSGISGFNQLIDQDKIPTAVYATTDGIVSQINVNKNTLSDGTSPVAVIATDSTISAILFIDEENIELIHYGDTALVSGPAVTNRQFRGIVTYICSSAKTIYSGITQKTVVEVGLTIQNPDSRLKVGYNVNASIYVNKPRSILVLPYQCIMQDDQGREYVLTLEGNKALIKYIVTGKELSDGLEILSGLTADDRVVADPSKLKYIPSLVIPKTSGGED